MFEYKANFFERAEFTVVNEHLEKKFNAVIGHLGQRTIVLANVRDVRR